jgi:leader peptidase (prepilin peptidase)/N-methyltransferase
MIRTLGTLFAGLLGLAFGSFLNVCLSRWPEGESVVEPRSHCRNCGRTLAWWENVPLLSWLALRGRCRTCRNPISWRYPLVELSVGVLWTIPAWRFMSQALDPRLPVALIYYDLANTLCTLLLLWLLVALAALDAEHLWLPNMLTFPGIALGFAYSVLKFVFLVKVDALTGLPLTSGMANVPFGIWGVVLWSLFGILAAAGIILLIRWVYWLIRRQEGIGLGDAKLMAFLAAWLGFPGALLAFVIGVLLGTVAALALLLSPKAGRTAQTWSMTKLPLGTFLCIGGIISALWGQQLITAYLRLEGF